MICIEKVGNEAFIYHLHTYLLDLIGGLASAATVSEMLSFDANFAARDKTLKERLGEMKFVESFRLVAPTHIGIRVEAGLSELGDPLLHNLQLRAGGNVIL